MNEYVVVDLETTSFSPTSGEILEIGALRVKDGVSIGKFNQLVKPVCYIPREVQQLTGIGMQDVAGCPVVEDVLPGFFGFCGGLPLLGHNVKFDYDFLTYHGRRLGLDFTLHGQRRGVCTLAMARKYLKLSSYKLADVAGHYKISISSEGGRFHRAGYDAYVTKLVYEQMEREFGVYMPGYLTERNVLYGRAVDTGALSFD